MTLRVLLAAAALAVAAPAQESWQIDPLHSAVNFSVKHMMVSTVRGQFGKVTGAVKWDRANIERSSVTAVVDVTSISTANAKRDADLRGPDFFDVAKYPEMRFQSTKITPAGAGKLRMAGNLTMRGITKEVVFDVEAPSPPVKGPNGLKSGAAATTRINRQEFGLTWNPVLEAGGVTVSDEVMITVDLELNGK
jgi:polyisoprenoid-binding protein YceI